MSDNQQLKQTEQEIRFKFFFETPLYELFKADNLSNILTGEVDAYNYSKTTETTYEIFSDEVDDYRWKEFYQVTLSCKRYGNKLIFFVIKASDAMMKIGQFPSLADIQFVEIDKKYNKSLNEEDLKNFKRAIGLAAHGIGAGSFVYLRRIFENLILETFQEHEEEISIKKEDFQKKKISEKVETIKGFLPQQIVDMKPLYSILSVGVHELTDQECLSYFGALKLAIELILDEKIEMSIKKSKEEEVKRTIQQIGAGLKDKK